MKRSPASYACASWRLTFFATWLLALAMPCRSLAFLRAYRDYEIVSANNRFVAEVRFSNTPSPIVRVQELKDGARSFRWQAFLFIPIAETIHLSNDGEFIVLENDYPYTDKVLYFYGKERTVTVYQAGEVESDGKSNQAGAALFPRTVGRHPGNSTKWSPANRFSFLSTAGQEACYCLWFATDPRWRAWRLQDGARLSPTPSQVERWDQEAQELAARTIATHGATRSGAEPPAPPRPPGSKLPPVISPCQAPELDPCYKFITRRRTAQDRKTLESMLSDAHFDLTGFGPRGAVVSVRAASRERSLGDRLLAAFDGKLRGDDSPAVWLERRFYLGGVKGLIGFAKPPTAKDGVLWVSLVPKAEAALRATPLPLQRLRIDFADVADGMKLVMEQPSYRLPATFEFSIDHVLPGEYYIDLVWRKNPGGEGPVDPGPPQPGDCVNEVRPLVIVTPGVFAEPEPLRCEKRVVSRP